MSLKRIKDSILTDAKKEAEGIIKDAKERLQERVSYERSKIEECLREKYTSLSKRIEEDKKRALTEQRTNYGMELLRVKNNIIEEIFKKAEEKFISEEQYWPIMEKWLGDIKESGRVFVNEKDSRRFNEGFVSRISKKDGFVVDQNHIDIKGGFILKTDRYELDRTLDTILLNLRDEMSPLIAKELFVD
jgi:V/A-type H+/Na+-transporting ATPase subunit E